MEAIKTFSMSTKQTKRHKEVVWMRKKNISQSFVFWKSEAEDRIKDLEKKGWTRMETPKSIFG